MSVPIDDGYAMPGEYAPHARCWMAWPPDGETFLGKLDQARDAYAAVARAIAEFEPVTMVARPEHAADAARRCGSGVSILEMGLNDAWMRDMGPTFLVDGKGGLASVHWRFNAWGEKGAYDLDEKVGRLVSDHLGIRRYSARPFVLEGGAFHVDGEGTLITTESCLLHPNRNPGLNREEIEKRLRDYLGVEKVIWLPGMSADTGTDGHVDGIACFVRPGVVMMEAPQGSDDPFRPILEENARCLRATRDARGREIQIIDLGPTRQSFGPLWPDGEDFPLGYVNYYIANGGVVMPCYGDVEDARAAETVARAFPDRRVVQVPALDIAIGGGMIHCITQQQPAGDAAGA
jgi:agmatine deiminase